MTQRTDTISITGEEEILDTSYIALASSFGWTPTIRNAEGNEIPNPQAAKDKALEVTRRFWGDIIRAYNSNHAAELARVESITQTDFALGTSVVTLELGSEYF